MQLFIIHFKISNMILLIDTSNELIESLQKCEIYVYHHFYTFHCSLFSYRSPLVILI